MANFLGPEAVRRNYFHAKDENRPHLLERVFVPEAELIVQSHAGTMVFPPRTVGREAIADVLVRGFGQTYENVYSFYLCRPSGTVRAFSCSWLVVMSEKLTSAVRVGCGGYSWEFDSTASGLATRLAVTIDAMQVLPPAELAPALAWVEGLDYPWCTAEGAVLSAPDLQALARVVARLRSGKGGCHA